MLLGWSYKGDDSEGIITDLRASKLHHHQTDWSKGNALDMY
jgi:hypothetical protein